ncbi:MAG: TIGR02453 family protein [Acidobacteria bacterium]|nr:TIGR02453 family protein [Acidobacteriota bacterium]
MATPPPRFSPRALTFLRALNRHNDREWFRERKDVYERELRAPMAALVERLGDDFRAFAPELVATPKASMFRPYRDTRFSEDKSPIKTNIAAVFPWQGFGRTEGAALYLELNTKTVLVAGGLYFATTAQLLAVREHLATHLAQFRSIVESPAFVRATGGLTGDQLQRVPRPFPKDHPAAEYLRHRQFLAWKEWPAAHATTPRFYGDVLRFFRVAAPLVRFLNTPLVAQRSREIV